MIVSEEHLHLMPCRMSEVFRSFLKIFLVSKDIS